MKILLLAVVCIVLGGCSFKGELLHYDFNEAVNAEVVEITQHNFDKVVEAETQLSIETPLQRIVQEYRKPVDNPGASTTLTVKQKQILEGYKDF